MCEYMCIYEGQRITSIVIFRYHLHFLFFPQGLSLAQTLPSSLGWLAVVTRDLLVSASLVCWFWGLNSGLGTCEIRTLIAVEPPAIDRFKNMKCKRHGPPHKPPVNPISHIPAFCRKAGGYGDCHHQWFTTASFITGGSHASLPIWMGSELFMSKITHGMPLPIPQHHQENMVMFLR